MPDTPTPQKSVLVVDDDRDLRAGLILILEAEGYRVAGAADGQQALEALRAGPRPDVILLDMMMPVLSGWAFRERQLADPALADVPVVVFSAVGDAVGKADALGDVGYLQKPVEVDQLLAVVERFSAGRRPEILVADDEAGVRKMLDVALRHYGFRVRLAAGSEEAVALYRRHRDTLSLVLLDVYLPG